MNKVKPKPFSESGLTLIALLVMIILIVILAAITIRGLTGNEGILSVAETAAEDYKIKAMKESLSEAIRAEMIAQATQGKTATLRRHSRKDKTARRGKRRKNRRRRKCYRRIHICRNR